jgi:ArsR family transcriptional regulator, arsenate/arsenite/antimonite-responsive transcriptional repressor
MYSLRQQRGAIHDISDTSRLTCCRRRAIISVYGEIPNKEDQMNNAVFRALADPTRRAILHLLRERSLTAGEIAAHFPQSASTMSGHFAVLQHANLVVQERQSQRLVYHLNTSVVEEAVAALLELTSARARTETEIL